MFDLFSILPFSLEDVTVYHVAFEALLVMVVIKLMFFTKNEPPRPKEERPTPKEEEQLIAEYVPEPLITGRTEDYSEPPIIDGVLGATVVIGGKEKVNLGTFNFLGLVQDAAIQKEAIESISKYGVGSCGPRGFYGTIDVHLDLEKALAAFLGVEEVVMYSYGFSTIASVIPAYSKRGDLIFYDKAVNFPIQKGLVASRSTLRAFDHNNMEHLESLLEAQAKEDRKDAKRAMATRRFLVVEGLYANTGSIAPLKKLVELKYKYKVRLILDESLSFGVLGKTGRGLTEHCDVPVDDVDMLVGSLETALGSIGGFCAGRFFVQDHQRLSAQGYCYSASLPPLLAIAAIRGLQRLQSTPALLIQLRHNTQLLSRALKDVPGLVVLGAPESPVLHLTLRHRPDSILEEEQKLQAIVDNALSSGLLLVRARYVRREELHAPLPSIRLAVSSLHTEEQLKRAAAAIKFAWALL